MPAIKFLRELFSTFWADFTCAFSLKNWREASLKVRSLTGRTFFRNLLLIAPQVLVFYFVLSPAVAMPFYDHLLFFPSKVHAFEKDALGVGSEDVHIPSGQNQIHGWYFSKPSSKGIAIVSHGNAGNISHRLPLIQLLLACDLSVLIYDYQGYGESGGTPTIDNICQDGLSVYDYLVEKRGIAPSKIVVYGESLGGGVSCHIAKNRPVGAIILQSTFSSLPHIAKEKIAFMRLFPGFLFPKNKLDNVAVLEEPHHAPVLIIHGKQDEIIPFTEAKRLYDLAVDPKLLVPLEKAGHNDMYGTYFAELSSGVSKFLEGVFK